MKLLLTTFIIILLSGTVFSQPKARFGIKQDINVSPLKVELKNRSKNALNYTWFIEDKEINTKDIEYTFSKAGNYKIILEAFDKDGNKSIKEKTVEILSSLDTEEKASKNKLNDYYDEDDFEKDYVMLFPNAFTPNKGGKSNGFYEESGPETNDIFHPTHAGVDVFNMKIYNRRGILIFETVDERIGWDGYYNSKLCPQGSYFFTAEGVFSNGMTFKKEGQILLLH